MAYFMVRFHADARHVSVGTRRLSVLPGPATNSMVGRLVCGSSVTDDALSMNARTSFPRSTASSSLNAALGGDYSTGGECVPHRLDSNRSARPQTVERAGARLGLAPTNEGEAKVFATTRMGLLVRLRDWEFPVVCDLANGAVDFDNTGANGATLCGSTSSCRSMRLKRQRSNAGRKAIPLSSNRFRAALFNP